MNGPKLPRATPEQRKSFREDIGNCVETAFGYFEAGALDKLWDLGDGDSLCALIIWVCGAGRRATIGVSPTSLVVPKAITSELLAGKHKDLVHKALGLEYWQVLPHITAMVARCRKYGLWDEKSGNGYHMDPETLGGSGFILRIMLIRGCVKIVGWKAGDAISEGTLYAAAD